MTVFGRPHQWTLGWGGENSLLFYRERLGGTTILGGPARLGGLAGRPFYMLPVRRWDVGGY